MKFTTIVIIAIIGLVMISAAGWGLKTVLLPAKTVTTQIDSAGDVISKTYDADNAIYNYEWFKQQYEDIQASERVISNTNAELHSYRELYGNATAWDWQTKQDYNSVNSKLTTQEQVVKDPYAKYHGNGGGGTQGLVVESPDLDGSYGTNGDGIFFFTTENAYVEWNGEYFVSDQPLHMSTPPILVRTLSEPPAA